MLAPTTTNWRLTVTFGRGKIVPALLTPCRNQDPARTTAPSKGIERKSVIAGDALTLLADIGADAETVMAAR